MQWEAKPSDVDVIFNESRMPLAEKLKRSRRLSTGTGVSAPQLM